ncbi:trk system potassium uptake protein TrkH [Geoalkalibacter ferrihydriticus]|uniref:Potassium transporter n=2 Tax=Geoalkalibacter ferrihydriticus TaxID=392333 RepID=A0A0C2HLX5_9BACT|nr:potassium transporter TrkG [Geoalkalibacter ferrihydriticus]KIH75985.1 potassium transporter [Geoalkalibacter ferrihydriticus DSM 17813]SDM58456.1 trk system potassium uptake protein TrkH [Geoalkalibacter ferrihydriticus]
MNRVLVLRILGILLAFLAAVLLAPIPFSLYFADGAWPSFLLSSLICAALGGVLILKCRSPREMAVRDGFAVVTFGWTAFALFGALPYLLSGSIPSVLDALFETMSGFTTTGATILPDIEALAPSILFWRALTQWLGGMGFIVLSLAILPMLGVGGMQMFKAEMPGPTADRLKPRIQDTAKLLWGVYVLLTSAQTLLLMLGGLSFFDALCHAFTTLASGGFSPKNASVGAYDSAYVDWVIILFMFLAAVNFALHYQVLRGRGREMWRNEEFRVFLGLTLVIIVLVMWANQGAVYTSLSDNLRYSTFQVVSIFSTTGYATADYGMWPAMSQYLLFLAMLVGGCAASTAGGMKVARLLLLIKHAQVQIYRLIHPRAVRLVKLGDVPVDREIMQSILGFFALWMAIFMVATILMASTGLDMVSAAGSVVATLAVIGPGFGSVGPMENYAHILPFGKSVLVVCMLLGRLELFTVLVLFFPTFWRK